MVSSESQKGKRDRGRAVTGKLGPWVRNHTLIWIHGMYLAMSPSCCTCHCAFGLNIFHCNCFCIYACDELNKLKLNISRTPHDKFNRSFIIEDSLNVSCGGPRNMNHGQLCFLVVLVNIVCRHFRHRRCHRIV